MQHLLSRFTVLQMYKCILPKFNRASVLEDDMPSWCHSPRRWTFHAIHSAKYKKVERCITQWL